MLAIEAGEKGWNSIEFKELLCSAQEYLGVCAVRKIVVKKETKYITELIYNIKETGCSHYFYDPRTGSQMAIKGIWESLCTAAVFGFYGIIPIVYLTDISVRRHRAQGAVVSVLGGVAISFMSAKIIKPIFPHGRIVGPSLMPFSKLLLSQINNILSINRFQRPVQVLFVGSLYEPRLSKLNRMKEQLSKEGITFVIKGRHSGGERISDNDYWASLCEAQIVVTTADQIDHPDNDWAFINQLVYRNLEAMACGTLLIAPDVPGGRRYFSPGEHYVKYDTPDDAINEIMFYMNNKELGIDIADRGRAHASRLIGSKMFWASIDSGLGSDALIS